jgi:hypothetical protein
MIGGFRIIRPNPHVNITKESECWDFEVGPAGELIIFYIHSGVGRKKDRVLAPGTWIEVQAL